MITGLNHITFSVKNLNESFAFYKETLGFRPLMKNKKSAYFLAGQLWFCIEEDDSVRKKELPEYTHVAFSVNQDHFNLMAEKIRNSNAFIFKENKSEGDSLYFTDPNGHKLEIHVGNWQSRLDYYKSRPNPEFEFFT